MGQGAVIVCESGVQCLNYLLAKQEEPTLGFSTINAQVTRLLSAEDANQLKKGSIPVETVFPTRVRQREQGFC